MTNELLEQLEEARKKHERLSNCFSNLGDSVEIKPEIFQVMLERGLNEWVSFNASDCVGTRPSGFYAHILQYKGVRYKTKTSKRIFIPELI